MSYCMDSRWEKQLDSYLTTPPKEKDTAFWCDDCGEDFNPGDKYYEIDGSKLCENCAKDWLETHEKVATEDDCFGDTYREDGDY